MATNAPQDDFHKTGLRLPKDLHARLHEAAAASGRSYNSEIVARLISSFEDPDDAAVRKLIGAAEARIAERMATIERSMVDIHHRSAELQQMETRVKEGMEITARQAAEVERLARLLHLDRHFHNFPAPSDPPPVPPAAHGLRKPTDFKKSSK